MSAPSSIPPPSNRSLFRHPCANKESCGNNRKHPNIFCFDCYYRLPTTLQNKLYDKDYKKLQGTITLCLEFLNPHDEREDS